jgi:hypothetical protein
MGSKGAKPRKPEHSGHLPKVGSATENEIALHEEREAVLGQFGARNASWLTKSTLTIVLVVIAVCAILGFSLLVVFR